MGAHHAEKVARPWRLLTWTILGCGLALAVVILLVLGSFFDVLARVMEN